MRRTAALAVALVGILWLAPLQAVAQQPDPPAPPDPAADPFFSDEVVQQINLTINPRDWKELRENFLTNRYFPCHFAWNGITVRNVGIRSRGTGSRSGTKPGLRVDFDYYTAKQRFLNLKSVVLRNNTQDASMLHERVSMKLFSRMGIEAPREAHLKLFVNDEYAGLYTIVESVDKVFLERHFRQNDGFLYEYDYDAEDEPYFFEYRGADPAAYSPKPFKPSTHEKDPDPSPLEALARVINEARGSEFRARIAEYLDMRRFMTHVATENFLAETDGILGDWAMNNFYFYRFEGRTLSTFIPWDKSHAFTSGFEHNIFHNVDVTSSRRNRLMERAMELPELVDAYLDALLRAAEIASSVAPQGDGAPAGPQPAGWLEGEILREYRQIREAALADPYKPFSNEQFEAGVQAMLAFARERSRYVTETVGRARGAR